MASPFDSAASVPPSTPLSPQPTRPPLPPQFTGPPLPPQPTLASTAMATSSPRIPIDNFYAKLNAKGYKFAEPEHPPEVTAAPSKVGATINLKIFINDKDLNTAIIEDVATTP
ncbi:unnamed protein product [Prunus armeniaca]|uniref:Uncharacterized protein n=1 Tax=Prunus armeniaca TaxID=36596 RepID=A0A6J5W3W8_PRUAR|nr:unnamed protein product [Prunus armeniaca]